MRQIKTLLILFNISVFLFSCASPGSLIDESVSDNHYYNASETGVIYAIMGGDCYSIGCKDIQGADVDTFQPLSNFYASDKNHAFYEEKMISGADPATFKLLDETYYAYDKNHVYYKEKMISGADPATFKLLDEIDYASDKNQVYYKEKMISGTDPETFKLLGETGYASDKNHVYYQTEMLSDENPDDFRVVTDLYAVGRHAVYWRGEIIPSADPDTFEAIPFTSDGKGPYYGKDKNAIFCGKTYLSDQPTLFRSLNEDRYFADGKDVYYVDFSKYFESSGLCESLGANPATFEFLYDKVDGSPIFYGKDSEKVFYLFFDKREVIEEADPETFEACPGAGSPHFAKDKYHVYGYGTVVEEANPKTFELPEECK